MQNPISLKIVGCFQSVQQSLQQVLDTLEEGDLKHSIQVELNNAYFQQKDLEEFLEVEENYFSDFDLENLLDSLTKKALFQQQQIEFVAAQLSR